MASDTSSAGADIRRLAALSANGAGPDRMVRVTTDIVLRWQSLAEVTAIPISTNSESRCRSDLECWRG